MKKKFRNGLACAMAAAMVLSLAACGQEAAPAADTAEATSEAAAETTEAKTDSAPVEISYATFMVGSHASAAAEAEVIAEFNRLHEGEIKVVIEELPSDDAFVDKMKTLASSKNNEA